MIRIVLLLALGLLSFSITYLIRIFAIRKGMYDIPNERSMHTQPVPKGGGLAISLCWYLGITVLYFMGLLEAQLYYAFLTGMALMIISFIDDLINLSPRIRLFIHFATAIAAFSLLHGLRPFVIPELGLDNLYILYPFVIVGIVWFINLYNFMDGVDGFAAFEAVLIGLVFFIFTGSSLDLLFVAAVSGFLYWNWPKAKIFMGDVGSTQLGFILVVLGLYYHNTYEFSIVNWVMITSPFWFDATYTLVRRKLNREKISQAHKKHIYQRLVQTGLSHKQINFYLFLVNLVILGMIFLYREFPLLKIPMFLILFVGFFIIANFVNKRVPFKN